MLKHPAIGAMIYYGRDVTERIRAQERERFLSLLVENSLDLMLVTDSEGNARYVNPANERILGYGREEYIGMNVPGLLHPDDRQRVMCSHVPVGEPVAVISPIDRKTLEDGINSEASRESLGWLAMSEGAFSY
jgi:PAS domain-containing protein